MNPGASQATCHINFSQVAGPYTTRDEPIVKRIPSTLLAAAFIAVSLTACQSEEAEVEPAPAVETPAEAPTAGTAKAAPAAAQTGLALARTQEHGPYIADQNGRALYLLEQDPKGESTCYDACAGVWPPYLAPQGTPRAMDPAVQAGLIGTIRRRDGSMQVTYGGKPLYYYTKDQGPGQATGHDFRDQWGEWYLVDPNGGELEDHGGGHS